MIPGVPHLQAISASALLVWIVVCPLVGGLLLAAFGSRLERRLGSAWVRAVGALPLAASAALAVLAVMHLLRLSPNDALSQPLAPLLHVGVIDGDWALLLDRVTAPFVLLATGLGLALQVCSFASLAPRASRTGAGLQLTVAAAVLFVLADNLLLMLIAWGAATLIAGVHMRAGAIAVQRVGDAALVGAMALLLWGLIGDFGASGGARGIASVGFIDEHRPALGRAGSVTLRDEVERDLSHAELSSALQRNPPPPTSLRTEVVGAQIRARPQLWHEASPVTKTLLRLPLIVWVGLLVLLAVAARTSPLFFPGELGEGLELTPIAATALYPLARLDFALHLSPSVQLACVLTGGLTACAGGVLALVQTNAARAVSCLLPASLGGLMLLVAVQGASGAALLAWAFAAPALLAGTPEASSPWARSPGAAAACAFTAAIGYHIFNILHLVSSPTIVALAMAAGGFMSLAVWRAHYLGASARPRQHDVSWHSLLTAALAVLTVVVIGAGLVAWVGGAPALRGVLVPAGLASRLAALISPLGWSAAANLGGWAIARGLYRRGPSPLVAHFIEAGGAVSVVHRLLVARFGVPRALHGIWALALGAAAAGSNLDRGIDGLLRLAAMMVRGLATVVTTVDALVLDGIPSLGARGLRWLRSRRR